MSPGTGPAAQWLWPMPRLVHKASQPLRPRLEGRPRSKAGMTGPRQGGPTPACSSRVRDTELGEPRSQSMQFQASFLLGWVDRYSVLIEELSWALH